MNNPEFIFLVSLCFGPLLIAAALRGAQWLWMRRP